jgi:ATP-dependent protease Clp ATPase subunit
MHVKIKDPTRELACSFCGKRQTEVKRLFADFNNKRFICDECVLLCTDMCSDTPVAKRKR